MSFFARVFKPSAGRRLLQNTDFLPSFHSWDMLTRSGYGKRLLPPTSSEQPIFEAQKDWATIHGEKFIRKCILNVYHSPLSVDWNPYEEHYGDRDQYRLRLFMGIALIDAVRANNHLDDDTLRKLLYDCEKYALKELSSNTEFYAQVVKALDSSDLYY
jgi:hypothetical protein